MSEQVTCYKCDSLMGYLENNEQPPESWKGLNYGIGGKPEWECSLCRRRRRQAYDDYVDPTGFYQNKNFDYD